jgi:hypothetical protein
MEDNMKAIFSAIVLAIVITVFGCSKKDNDSNPIVNNHPVVSHGYLVEGEIVAEFTDTLLQVNAERFLLAHDLTVYTLYNFDKAPPHSGIIEIPIGQEWAWIDTLQKYPEIKHAGRIGVVETAN